LSFLDLTKQTNNLKGIHVLLGCEMGGKYKKYKHDLQPSIIRTRKCNCSFKLQAETIGKGEG